MQVADSLCLPQKPETAEMCSITDDGLLNGVVCSGNGIYSQSAAQCICNSGWQVCNK